MAKQQLSKNKIADNPTGLFKFIFHPLFIFVFSFLLYSNTLKNGFVEDDGAVITDNVTTQKGFAGIGELLTQSSVYGSTKQNYGSYRPVVMVLFATEKQFFGNNSTVFHLVHILLYALCCSVVLFTLRKSFQNLSFGGTLAGVATLIFATHPVHTEVAANIKSVDEVLNLTFGFLSLCSFIRFNESGKKIFFFWGWLAFLVALFSKESAITFLVLIPLAMFLFNATSWKNLFSIVGANSISVIIFFLIRHSVLDEVPTTMPIVDNVLMGAATPGERVGTVASFLLQYLRLLVFPHPLSWDYGYNQIPLVTLANPFALASILFHCAILIYALVLLWNFFSSKTVNRKPKTENILAFSILFYLITLSPISNIFFLIASNIAERFLFAPSLAFCILVSLFLLKVSKFGITGQSGNKVLLSSLLVAILIPYSAKTWMRNQDWKSNYTLFATGVFTSPNSYRTNVTFGWESVVNGEKETNPERKKQLYTDAVTYFKKGISIYDKRDYDWFNYGVANGHLNNNEEAMKAYQQAILINPKHRNSCYNLASIYMGKEDYSNALKYFLGAYKADSNFSDLRFKIGLCYHYIGDYRNAVSFYEKHFKAYPDSRDVVNNLTLAYQSLGDKEKTAYYSTKLQQMK